MATNTQAAAAADVNGARLARITGRERLQALALAAVRANHGFRIDAETVLEHMRRDAAAARAEVRNQTLTPRQARERLAAKRQDYLRGLQKHGRSEAEGGQHGLALQAERERRAKAAAADDKALFREMVRELRLLRVRQEVADRADELASLTHDTDRITGSRRPDLDKLLSVYELGRRTGDDAAQAYARRELARLPLAPDDDASRERIALALETPEAVNPSRLGRLVEELTAPAMPEATRAAFARQAIDDGDATTLAVAWVVGRRVGAAEGWAEKMTAHADRLSPDALDFLSRHEAESTARDAAAIDVITAWAAEALAVESALSDLPPTPVEAAPLDPDGNRFGTPHRHSPQVDPRAMAAAAEAGAPVPAAGRF